MPMTENIEQGRTFSRRLILLMGAQGLALTGLVARMYQLQVSESERYTTLAEENRINTRLLLPPRGRIFDRHGRPLAVNEEDYRVVIVAEKTGSVHRALDRLAGIIELSPEARARAEREVRRRRRFLPVTIATGLTWEEVARIEVNAPDLPGILTERGLTRVYPYGELVSHLIGYVGPVNEREQKSDPDPLLKIPEFRIGKLGIEKTYDNRLRGSSGTQRVEINASGRVQRELSRHEGASGEDIHMTIDTALQRKALDLIQPHRAASVVVMDIHTGDVLVMASTPSYDPNLFIRGLRRKTWRALQSNKLGPLRNKAIAGQYAPGSTFKMLVAISGLEAGAINAGTAAQCKGVFQLGKAKFHCWRRGGHGSVALHAAIKSSCDVYFYQLALQLGVDRIAQTANRLGLGTTTEIDLPAEIDGLIPTKAWKRSHFKRKRDKVWFPGETVITGIGQGYVLATPLQLAVMTARIANGGYAVTPRLVADQPAGYRTAYRRAPATFRKIGFKDGNLKMVQQAMAAVTNEKGGTAYWTRITDEGMEMAGKTGTSQVRRITAAERARGVIRNDQLPWHRRDHALFVSYAPVDDPRFACAVIVEHGGGGSRTAAPIAKEILLETQKRYPLRPDRASLDATTPFRNADSRNPEPRNRRRRPQ